MQQISTEFGTLTTEGFSPVNTNTKHDGFFVSGQHLLMTPYGELVPQYESEDMGRRPRKPVYLYKDGRLKSLPLQEQATITTPVGPIPAELLTFHPNGSLKRIFPLDGKLSGFWSWQNEKKLAVGITIPTPAGTITLKAIGLQFYANGSLKSITFWPGESAEITSPAGPLMVRKGIAFYEDGTLRSCEPQAKTAVNTPIGEIIAYDNAANGIHGDNNSLEFHPDGSIASLKTIDTSITVDLGHGNIRTCSPGVQPNICGDERLISVPMEVRFEPDKVIIDKKHTFKRSACRFTLTAHKTNALVTAASCG